jgi:hypothetical protein
MVSSDPLPRGLDQPKCPSNAPARDPAAFNAHRLGTGASGLVQHVFHLPARIPIAEPLGETCAPRRQAKNALRYQ